jgi:CHASE2 domain-containing sensor protein
MDTTVWWFTPLAWLFARRPDWRDALGRLLLRLGIRFYFLLAILFVLAGAWDLFAQPFNKQLSDDSFDWLMSHRPIPYRPDPAIVVLDIDESSLNALAAQYGRWPWPRQLLAEVATSIEAAQAQAVAFDILFADPDVANESSERAFDSYVSSSRRSFYSAVRLNPNDDRSSQITLSMLKFAEPTPGLPAAKIDGQRTVALLPPYFKSIYDSTRTGITNIVPDQDNVVRWYVNFETLGGYRIPSLPYRMAQALHWPLPRQSQNLINWPRGAMPYQTVTFADAYRAAERHDNAFFSTFADKVVLIGSTAPSLNDLKATPVDRLHPGIDLLAVVIDNVKNNRYLHTLHSGWIWALEILMLAASARLFARTNRVTAVARYFVIVPTALLLISLISISVSDLLMDLSVPAALVLGYFAFAKIYQSNSLGFVSGTGAYAPTEREILGCRLQVACLPASVPREHILARLIGASPQFKLWEPAIGGLGSEWMAQGWVLWRWSATDGDAPPGRSASANDADEFELRWRDVAEYAAPGNAFQLATAIAAAAQVHKHSN